MGTLEHIRHKFKVDIEQPVVKLNIDRNKRFPRLLNSLGFRKGAEIGVLRGRNAQRLFLRIKDLKLYLVDPYLEYQDYKRVRTQKELDNHEAVAKWRLGKFNCEWIKKPSMEAVWDFKDESLDFVHIDANHAYAHVICDIIHWSDKVRKGGIVSGHDYSPREFEVKKAVDDLVWIDNIKPLFLIKNRVWFYVKT